MRALVVVVILGYFLWPGFGAAQTDEPLPPTFIAKSTFVYLADATSKSIQPKGFAYLPAGTRFLAYRKTIDYLGSTRRLILTADGIWAYVIDSDEYYWNPIRTDFFRENDQAVIVRQKYFTSARLSDTIALSITLTASELYRFIRETENGLVIAIDNKKVPQLQSTFVLEVTVPNDYATLWKRTDKLSLKDIHPFEESVLDNVRGIRKDCDTNQVSAIVVGGGIGLDITKFLVFLKLNATAETRTIQEFGTDVNVYRWYYRRGGSGGVYSVTKKMDCNSQEWTYSFSNTDYNEIIFNTDLATRHNLVRDIATSQVLVTCPEQYFTIEKLLLERSYSLNEIPFIISRTAKFKDISRSACAAN